MESTLSEMDRKFLTELHDLMLEYQINRQELLKLLDRSFSGRIVTGPTPQPLRVYCNPFTGHVIRVRADKNLTYRAWVTKYGQEVVATWLTP
ncbi:hypothetical protein D9M69_563830 [compost metagenome]